MTQPESSLMMQDGKGEYWLNTGHNDGDYTDDAGVATELNVIV